MSRRIKPKEKYVRISMKEIWRNLDGPSKNKELWSYVVSFKCSRPKVAPALHALLISFYFVLLLKITQTYKHMSQCTPKGIIIKLA